VQIMTEAQFASGQPYQPVELSRRFTAYYATQVLDPTMNPDDGGTISATLTALSNAQPGGMGVCREVTWRWHCGADESYNRQVLAECPFSLAIQDASPDRICQIAEAPWGTPSVWQALIANGHPIHIGIDWPANWDEGSTFVDSIGEIVGSHALIIIGWFTDPSGVLYWMLDNSHGPIYAPHPVPFAGYDLLRHPAYAFFVSDQVLGRLMKPGSGAESMVACGVTGFIVRPQLLTFAQAFAR